MKRRPAFFEGFLADHAREICASIADDWSIPLQLAYDMAGVPAEGSVSREGLDRVTHLLSLKADIDKLFMPDYARRWPTLPNPSPAFRGACPVTGMAEIGLEAIISTRRHVRDLLDGYA